MATTGDYDALSIAAGADLSACQYLAVGVAGTIAATPGAAIGILQNKPKINEGARVAFSGHMKGRVGAAVSAGDVLVVTTSGFLITNATSTSGVVGKAIKAANSGSPVEMIADFSTVRVSYSIGIV
jgi:hypothetical protein